MTIEISVIVPVFNEAKHLERCIGALLTQRYPANRYEIIVVDNNSADGSRVIAERHARVKLLHESKQGAYAARNRGVAAASGVILAFTDADCVPASDWLDRIAAAVANPEVEVVLGFTRFAHDDGVLGMMAAYEAEKVAYICAGNEPQLYYGYTNNLATHRATFERSGPFVEVERGADVVFVRRVVDRASCAAVRFAPDAVVRHSEVTSAWDYCRKRFTYGRSLERYRRIASARPLRTREQLRIFSAARRRHGCALASSSLFLVTLVVGAVFYRLGRLAA